MTSFASAVKNLTIYPANHPRVVARADEFVEHHKALHGIGSEPTELIIQKTRVLFGGETVHTDHLAVEWLITRCRETGTSAIHIDRNSQAEDVVEFATALIACPPGSGRSLTSAWCYDGARIRPVELVVGEHRDKSATIQDDLTPPPDTNETVEPLAMGLADRLRAISDQPDVRRMLSAIEAADTTDSSQREDIDVVAMIGDLLPADIAIEGDELREAVETILARTLTEIRDMAEDSSRVRGAALLRTAVGMAKNYFGRQQQKPQHRDTKEKPTGRAGDDKITADLNALLAELAELPEPGMLRLPPAEEFADTSAATAKELVGITVHGLCSSEQPEQQQARAERIAALAREHPMECMPILDAHLRSNEHSNSCERLRLLRSLVDAGLADVIYNRAYIDDELLRAGFPEVLPIAARVLRSDRDIEAVRQAFVDIEAVISNGGIDAAVESGHLNDAPTVAMLARVGGAVAQELLLRCDTNDADTHEQLLLYARQLDLPDCERAVLDLHDLAPVPPYYVRRLVLAAAKQNYDRTVRRATSELLREFLGERAAELPFARSAKAIRALGEMIDVDSEQCLRRLSRIGWFRWSPEHRQVRRLAKATLSTRLSRKKP